MTYDMIKTEYRDFPIQYGEDVVEHLNLVHDPRMFNFSQLKQIGKAVSTRVRPSMDVETSDGYEWFGGLQFKLGRGKVAILFPWATDFYFLGQQILKILNHIWTDQ